MQIIDLTNHTLYVEDISGDIVDSDYDGSFRKYIENNYDLGTFTWGFINDAYFIPAPPPYDDPIEIDFDELKDI